MKIDEVVALMSEKERSAAQAVETLSAAIDHPYFWHVDFFVKDKMYRVDILHRYDEIKDAKCTCCQQLATETANCPHIHAAYLAIATQLAEPISYNVEQELDSYSKEDLVYMLTLLHRQSEELLQPFLQPATYTKAEAYTIIDTGLSAVDGLIDEHKEEIAFAGLHQVERNAKWLYKRNPILAIRHQLACLERLSTIEERCDEGLYEMMYCLTQIGLEQFIKKLKKTSLAQAATDELLHAIQNVQQDDLIEYLFDVVIQLSLLSQKRGDIEKILAAYKGTTLSHECYERLAATLKQRVMT